MSLKITARLWAEKLQSQGYEYVPNDETLLTYANDSYLLESDLTEPGFRDCVTRELEGIWRGLSTT